MTYTFKLARRLAVSRSISMLATLLLLSSILGAFRIPQQGEISPQPPWTLAAPPSSPMLPKRSPRRRRPSARPPEIIPVLQEDAGHAWKLASRMRTRGSFFLLTGVSLVVCGVLTWWLNVPPYLPGETPELYLARALPSLGVLLPMEGLGWFFLRQYRPCMEDYNRLLARASEREKHRGAFLSLGDEPGPAERCMFAIGLLTGDMPGRSEQGVVPQAPSQQAEPYPLLSLLQTLLARRQ